MKTIFALVMLVMATVVSAQVYQQGAVNLNFTGRLNEAKATAISSQATVNLGSAAGNLVHIAGSTTITSFGTASQAGIRRIVIFDNVLALTYNASTLAVPGNTTITTAAGDMATVVSDSTTKWVVVNYTRRATAP